MLQILIAICLMTIIGLLWKVMKQQNCPTDNQLKNFYLGRYKHGSEKAKMIISHLGICEECQGRIEEYSEL